MPTASRTTRSFKRDRRGVAAVEFALVAPMLIALMIGMLSYGGYFWTAHTLQQAANDAARAAIGGLNDRERHALAIACLNQEFANSATIQPALAQVDLTRNGGTLTVRVRYDASDSVFWAFSGIAPMPSPHVARQASIRLGGY
jgi:Flp pilus assembly protein TadG